VSIAPAKIQRVYKTIAWAEQNIGDSMPLRRLYTRYEPSGGLTDTGTLSAAARWLSIFIIGGDWAGLCGSDPVANYFRRLGLAELFTLSGFQGSALRAQRFGSMSEGCPNSRYRPRVRYDR
jgi:hypothetical protein